jgi:hypothetical protein
MGSHWGQKSFTFCRQEASKAKDGLVQTLKSGEGAQTIEKTEEIEVKSLFFR